MSTLNKPLCTKPFTSAVIDFEPNLKFAPCCLWRHTDQYQFNADSIQSYLASPTLAKLKKDFANLDQLPANCETCRQAEAHGQYSMRQQSLEGDYFADQLQYVEYTFFDNQCNMACFMCKPQSSTTLAHEYVSLGWLDQVPRVDNSSQIDSLRTINGDITLIVTGGEPLISKRFADLVDLVLEKNWSIDLISNGSVINTKAVERLIKVKHVKLNLSMDGVGETYDLMRWPFTWTNFDQNLTYFKQHIDQVSINFTAQVLNIHNLVDSINYANSRSVPIRVEPVRWMPWLNWGILTDSERDAVIGTVQNQMHKSDLLSRQKYSIIGVLKQIKETEHSPSDRDMFVNRMHQILSHRNININITPWFPELNNRVRNEK